MEDTMINYIDTEKLIAEIERFSATEYGGNTFGDDVANGALDYVLEEIIPSLQQEQPEVDLEKEIKNKRRTMLLDLFGPMNGEQSLAIKNFARHFYELGRKGGNK